jgi:hypothetical protein
LGLGRGGRPNKPKLDYSLQGNMVDEFKWSGSISDMAMKSTHNNFDRVDNLSSLILDDNHNMILPVHPLFEDGTPVSRRLKPGTHMDLEPNNFGSYAKIAEKREQFGRDSFMASMKDPADFGDDGSSSDGSSSGGSMPSAVKKKRREDMRRKSQASRRSILQRKYDKGNPGDPAMKNRVSFDLGNENFVRSRRMSMTS